MIVDLADGGVAVSAHLGGGLAVGGGEVLHESYQHPVFGVAVQFQAFGGVGQVVAEPEPGDDFVAEGRPQLVRAGGCRVDADGQVGRLGRIVGASCVVVD